MTIEDRYIEKLNNIPAPGKGCHPALLGAANVGALAGIPPEKVFSNIRSSIQAGRRRVSDREIHDAVCRAYKDNATILLPNGERYKRYATPKADPVVYDGKATLRRIIDQRNIFDEADLWEASPVRIDWPHEDDTVNFLSAMFEPSDMIFIGEREALGIVGQNIRSVSDWIDYFRSGGMTAPFIIINPLNGRPGPKKTRDGDTYRGDNNIQKFRYCLVEFDDLDRKEQIRFWAAAKLPKAALIDSGGKSIHGWIRLSNINSLNDWQKEVRQGLYEQCLIPLGVDPACSNPARLSRLPGHMRTETKRIQKILWLSQPEKERIGWTD